jgi:type IV pilus assembly protein PilP
MRVLRSFSFVILTACATAMLSAQQTKASTPAPAKTAPAPSPVVPAPATVGKDAKGASPAAEPAKPESTPPDSYAYDPGGRRDPFLTLIGPANNARNGTKIDSASGIAVAELSVRGVLESRGKLVAMVKGPDNKTYIVHQGDKLLDGAIKSITPLGLVIEQEVNDPLSVVKQREVRKLLRGLEDAK